MTATLRFALITGIAIAGMVAATPSHAQSRPHALADGAGALVFGVNSAPSLNAFNGMLAYKHHRSEQRAYRLGVHADFQTQRGAALINARLRTEAIFLRYPHPSNDVKLYWGWGPTASIDHHSVGTNNRTQYQWRGEAGLSGKLGVEWFATEHISFFGEYSTTAALRIGDTSDTDVAYDVVLGQTFASFGLAAYFR